MRTTQVSGNAVIDSAAGLDALAPVERFEETLSELRQDVGAILDLLSVSLGEHRLAEITSRSYLHPNGFAKIVLHDPGPDRTSVRLHVWPQVGKYFEFVDALRSDTAPHGHRWNFASTIMAGTGLLVEDFVPDQEKGELYDRFVFAPGRGPDLRPDGTERLRCTEYYVRHHDEDVYWCDPDLIHMISPIDDRLTATLVLQGPELLSSAPVYWRHGMTPDRGRIALEAPTIERLVADVISDLDETFHPAPGSTSEAGQASV